MKIFFFVTDYLSSYDVIVLTHQSDQKCIWRLVLSNCILLHETFHDYSFWEALCKILKNPKWRTFWWRHHFFIFFTRKIQILHLFEFKSWESFQTFSVVYVWLEEHFLKISCKSDIVTSHDIMWRNFWKLCLKSADVSKK